MMKGDRVNKINQNIKLIDGLVYCLVMVSIWLLFLTPAWGAIAQPERHVLTLELLQQRARSPMNRDGVPTIDLRRLIIDLRPENAEFRDLFYRLLRHELYKSSSPVGLDLSYSLIQGEFNGAEIGLRVPLYGQALSLLSPAEQEQLQRDRRRLSQLSQLSRTLLATQSNPPPEITIFYAPLKLVQTTFKNSVNFKNTFFLGLVEAQGAMFEQDADWSETRFSQSAIFSGAKFAETARFRGSIFLAKANFPSVQFQGVANFQGTTFSATANFNQTNFSAQANFSRIQCQGNADFSGANWRDRVIFDYGKFNEFLFLTETTFEQPVSFRSARFNQKVNLRGATIVTQAAFSDAGFSPTAYLNVAGLSFDSETAKILGSPGEIGKVISVPTLQGNETLLRNLVRNFRILEQIADANQIELMTAQLKNQELQKLLGSTNINTASQQQLIQLGFTPDQAAAILESRDQQVFRSLSEILTLKPIDLATYIKVRDRAVASQPLSAVNYAIAFVTRILHWLGLSLLLLLSCDGTSFGLVFGVGILSSIFFALLFWCIDRYRDWRSETFTSSIEIFWMFGSFSLFMTAGLLAIFHTSLEPWLTLICLGFICLPIPLILVFQFYRCDRHPFDQKDFISDSSVRRQHLMKTNVSYFVEDASMRQLRLTIGRLPIRPRYSFFRDRYMPLLCDRRWNWLNYYDFSLNNLFKFGFNDIRLRDEHLPGAIATLVWYQWTLGILYLTLLLWTLSRTIPGLNLLIYLK